MIFRLAGKSYFLLLLFIALLHTPGMAQRNEVFSGDPATYMEELSAFMTNLPEQYKDVQESFVNAWEKDSLFDETERQNIITISQLLIKRKARPYPHFYKLMQCMLAFEEYNQNPQNYTNWVNGFINLLEKRKTKTLEFDNLLGVTNVLLRKNYLYESGSTTWKATSPVYRIETEDEFTVVFDKTDLVCYSKRDSMHLFETRGVLYPIENIWKGETGLVTWERGGYSRHDVFARLASYQIDLTKSEYTAEDVTFTNKIYFDEPLKGVLNDKVKYNSDPEDATYPKFDSYTKKFVIHNLYDNIDYEGGLSMQGAKLVGTGTQENNAKLKIYRNDTLVLTASSVYFGFRADRISSQQTAINIKLRQDSIYHPNLFFTYRVKNRELTLLKTDNYSSQGPYFNSYHKIDMNFDQLSWLMDENVMRFTAPRGSSIGNAYFESVNYFNYNKYMDMMMLDNEHPLYVLKKFAAIYGSDEFPIEAYADYLNMPLHQVQHQMMRMAFGGFVFYDMNKETVTLKPRLYDYLAASINKIDYDVIGFDSRVESPRENAVYNIQTNDLTINGISEIHLSDSQNVWIYPIPDRIVLKYNRDFQFDGVVEAGLLTFFGKNFFFDYDSFKIKLQNVDSLKLDYQTDRTDGYGFPVIEHVESQIQLVTGEVMIDKPDNKSGRESYPEYPIFISKQNSYVYYNRKYIQNGVYGSDSFYFKVYPFEMDSLDNFNYRDLNFKGEFVSAGIFPSFEKELSLQPDNSLGFRQLTPEEGYPVYDGKGTYFNEMWLSNKGLRGDGKLEYLTSTTWSNDFIFYPDSMNTLSARYEIARKTTETQYPAVNSVNNYIHWMPYEDVMIAKKTDTDFNMFNDSTYLSGDLALGPSGLSGSGRMNLSNADLKSNDFTFKAEEIGSDTTDFFLKSLHTDGFTVLCKNVSTSINFQEHKGWIKSNEGYSLVEFPENKYISYIDYFIWDMDKKELSMGSATASAEVDYTDENSEPEGPRYISVHHDQDSLNFVAPLANYDYENNEIHAMGVKYITVADARIYPFEGEVTVERDAKMRTLEKARIRTDTLTRYHTIHTATVNIASRNYYSGLGNYDYVDENDEVHMIHFNEIKVDSGHTVASGDIYEAAHFRLSPVFEFQGRTFLRAPDSLLTFKGGVKIEHNCDQLEPSWLYFQTAIDPDNIYIPLPEQPVNIDRQKIYAGMYMYYDSVHIYPAFLTAGKSYSDRTIVTSHGYLYYDKVSQLFKIGSKEKINDFTLPENYLNLHREECRIYGEGHIDLGEDLGQVKLDAYGNIKHELTTNETTLDIVLMVDFYLSEPMAQLMAYEIDSAQGLQPVDMNRLVWKKTMDALVGAEEAKKLSEELTLFGTIKELPPELKHRFTFSDLKLKWNDATNSYQSVGQIGIASIDNVQINKMVNGYMELQIKRSGDIFDFYLEVDRRTYYYFGYTRGVMQTLSGNREYVETIMNMKPKDRKMKVHRGETSYIYMISTDRKKNAFYQKYRDALEGRSSEEENEE